MNEKEHTIVLTRSSATFPSVTFSIASATSSTSFFSTIITLFNKRKNYAAIDPSIILPEVDVVIQEEIDDTQLQSFYHSST